MLPFATRGRSAERADESPPRPGHSRDRRIKVFPLELLYSQPTDNNNNNNNNNNSNAGGVVASPRRNGDDHDAHFLGIDENNKTGGGGGGGGSMVWNFTSGNGLPFRGNLLSNMGFIGRHETPSKANSGMLPSTSPMLTSNAGIKPFNARLQRDASRFYDDDGDGDDDEHHTRTHAPSGEHHGGTQNNTSNTATEQLEEYKRSKHSEFLQVKAANVAAEREVWQRMVVQEELELEQDKNSRLEHALATQAWHNQKLQADIDEVARKEALLDSQLAEMQEMRRHYNYGPSLLGTTSLVDHPPQPPSFLTGLQDNCYLQHRHHERNICQHYGMEMRCHGETTADLAFQLKKIKEELAHTRKKRKNSASSKKRKTKRKGSTSSKREYERAGEAGDSSRCILM